jgi:hypothetical protein
VEPSPGALGRACGPQAATPQAGTPQADTAWVRIKLLEVLPNKSPPQADDEAVPKWRLTERRATGLRLPGALFKDSLATLAALESTADEGQVLRRQLPVDIAPQERLHFGTVTVFFTHATVSRLSAFRFQLSDFRICANLRFSA